MELEVDFSKITRKIEDFENNQVVVKRSMTRIGIEAEKIAKRIVNTFIDSKGHSQGVDSGAFRDGIRSSPIEFGFVLSDSVPYGIYHEYGTEPHWLPFFDDAGALTGLGKWAMRHFSDVGEDTLSVTGKRGKALKNPSRASREEKLKKLGGITVSLDEMAPFRSALIEAEEIAPKIFREEYEKWLKEG